MAINNHVIMLFQVDIWEFIDRKSVRREVLDELEFLTKLTTSDGRG